VTFWDKNKKILQQQYGGLFEEITKGENNGFLPEDLKIETTPLGELTLSIKGIYVHSQRDPLREAQRLSESVAAENGAVVILGFGLGYAAEAAVKLGRPVIVAEKNKNILLKAFELRDFTDFLSQNRIIFIVGGSGEGIVNALEIANDPSCFVCASGKKEKPSVIRNKALFGLDEEWYKAIDGRIAAWAMKDDVNTATHRRFGYRWMRNLSRNMSVIRDYPGVLHLKDLAASNIPVFLAAAGPSLDKIKPLLREIHERCIIVAVDTSLRFFVHNGIQPDFTVVMDPQFWNSRHLDRCDPNTALVAETAVYPPVLRMQFKNKFLCGSMFPLGEYIEKQVDPKGTLAAGGSVATTAWDFARLLGAGEIWIAGLDLAFPDLKTHFKGARFETISNSASSRFSPGENWVVRSLRDGFPFKAASAKGAQVLTDKRLSLYAAWFNSQFRRHTVKNYCLFPEGLAITGLQAESTEKFLALPVIRSEIDSRIKEAFLQIENKFNGLNEKNNRAQRYENAVSVLKQSLEILKDDAVRGEEIARAAPGGAASKGNLNLKEQEKVYKELEIIAQRVKMSEVKKIADFMSSPAQDALALEDNDPFCAYLKSMLGMFSGIKRSCDFILREIT